jgi:flagellum-specific peptidoglycan hydrolase FlgJ
MTTAKLIYLTLCLYMPKEHAEIATKQAILETGWFKSYAYTELCNPFGLMWRGKVQGFTSETEGCKQYYQQIYTQYCGGDYYEFLQKLPYAEDPNYISKLKQIHFEK